MRLRRLFILLAAAGIGTSVYKCQPALDNLNGPGSLGESVRASKKDAAGDSSSDWSGGGGIGGVGSSGFAMGQMGHGGNPMGSSSTETSSDDLAIIQAAARNDASSVIRRLKAHVKVDSRDGQRRTALMFAAASGNDDIMARLLAAGANPYFKDENGNNAFDYAAGQGLPDSVQFLLTHARAEDDRHYVEYANLIKAAINSDVSQLPEGGGRLAAVNRIDPAGQAPLFIAAGNGALSFAKALLARGADAKLANQSGQTPLHWAAWNNQASMMQLLIEHGAEVSATDTGGNTALMLAVENNSKDAVKLLLAKGADKYAANREGKTAAIIAEDKGYGDLAEMLQ